MVIYFFFVLEINWEIYKYSHSNGHLLLFCSVKLNPSTFLFLFFLKFSFGFVQPYETFKQVIVSTFFFFFQRWVTVKVSTFIIIIIFSLSGFENSTPVMINCISFQSIYIWKNMPKTGFYFRYPPNWQFWKTELEVKNEGRTEISKLIIVRR